MAAPLLPIAALGAVALFFAMKGGDAHAAAPANAHDMLDANMPDSMKQAVIIAYQNETDPAKLRAFAATLLPDFPKANALLLQAAHTREQQAAANAMNGGPSSASVPLTPLGQVPLTAPAGPSGPPSLNPVTPLAPPAPLQAAASAAASAAANTIPMTVTTQTDPLNLRQGPDTATPSLGLMPKGSIFVANGPSQLGFTPGFSVALGKAGWASSQYLTPSAPAASLQNVSSTLPTFVVVSTPSGVNLRSGPSTKTTTLKAVPNGTVLQVTGPNAPADADAPMGWTPVRDATGTAGFATAQYLQAAPNGASLASSLASAVPTLPLTLISASSSSPSLPAPTAQLVRVNTPNGVNIRSGPSVNQTKLGAAPNGTTLRVIGPTSPPDSAAPNGWTPVAWDDEGISGFATAQFLVPIATQTAGYVARYTAGASSPPSPEVTDAAQALNATLRSGECSATQEPTVRRFQQVARHVGLYSGPLHGFYDQATSRALAGALGVTPKPACVTTGGPRNPDTYWVPRPGQAA